MSTAFVGVLAPHHRSARATALFALALLAIGIAMALWSGSERAINGLQSMVAAALVIWWWLGSSRALAMLLSLAGERAPGVARSAAATLGGQILFTVAPSSLLLIALGVEPLRALAVCWTAAMAGLLLSSVSPTVIMLLLVGLFVGPRLQTVLPESFAQTIASATPASIPLGAAGICLALLNLALIGRLLRDGARNDAWHQPMAVAIHQLGSTNPERADDRLSQWLSQGPISASTTSPQARLAAVLGRPFHSLDTRSRLAELAPVLALIALWTALVPSGGGRVGMFVAFAPVMVLVQALSPALRLQRIVARPSAERSEVPLLPGLPGAADIGRVFSRLAAGCVMRNTLCSALLFLAFLAAVGASALSLQLLLVVSLSALPVGLLAALWIAGGRGGTPVFVAAIALGLVAMISGVLVGKTALAALGSWLLLGWLLLAAIAASLLPLGRRRLMHQPNRFLVR